MVADARGGNPRAHFLHDTCAFVPEYHGRREQDLAGHATQVVLTQPVGMHSDDDFAIWMPEFHVIDDAIGVPVEQNRSQRIDLAVQASCA